MESGSKPASPAALPLRPFDVYSTVMISRDGSSGRCFAQVRSCGVRGVDLMCAAGQRFPSWFRSGTVFTIAPPEGIAYLARVHVATATTAQIELLRESPVAPSTRAHARVPVNQPVRVAPATQPGAVHVALLRDVSAGGCRICLAEPLDVGTPVALTACLLSSVVELAGTVVAAYRADEIAHDHGVAFAELDPVTRRVIADFIRFHRAA